MSRFRGSVGFNFSKPVVWKRLLRYTRTTGGEQKQFGFTFPRNARFLHVFLSPYVTAFALHFA